MSFEAKSKAESKTIPAPFATSLRYGSKTEHKSIKETISVARFEPIASMNFEMSGMCFWIILFNAVNGSIIDFENSTPIFALMASN